MCGAWLFLGAPVKINVNVNLSSLMTWADSMARDQVPFATALALTKTAQLVREAEKVEMTKVFDRPTRYTLNSLYLSPARKDRLWAEVWLKDTGDAAAAKYLQPQIDGGKRSVKRFERRMQDAGIMPKGWVAVPGRGVRLDSNGNMSSQQIVQILSVLHSHHDIYQRETFVSRKRAQRSGKQRDYFVISPTVGGGNNRAAGNGGRLPFGVYQRVGGSIVTILFFAPSASYMRRFDFFGVARRVMDRELANQFKVAMQRAIDTARR